MTDQLRDLVRQAGLDPHRPLRLDEVTRRARQIKRRRRAAYAAVPVLAVLLVVGLLPVLTGQRVELAPAGPTGEWPVYPLPDRGEVSAGWLPDDTPVFISHDVDGRVHVLGATMPHGGDAAVTVGWCAESRGFSSLWLGDRFAPDGRFVGGPSLRNLPRHQSAVEGEQVRIGPAEPPSGRAGPTGDGIPGACQRDDGTFDPAWMLVHDYTDRDFMGPMIAWGGNMRMLDDPVLLDGWVRFDRAGVAVCSRDAGPSCPDPHVAGSDPGDDATAVEGRVLVEPETGHTTVVWLGDLDEGIDADAAAVVCDPPPYRPTYLPWLGEGEAVGEPDAQAGGTVQQRSATLNWADDPEAFADADPAYNGGLVIVSTNYAADVDPSWDQTEVLGHPAHLVWIGDPGIGPVTLIWRERPGPCGSYSVSFGMTSGLLDYIDWDQESVDQADGAEVDERMLDLERALESELLRVADSLIHADG